jgi:hypothetical protein
VSQIPIDKARNCDATRKKIGEILQDIGSKDGGIKLQKHRKQK